MLRGTTEKINTRLRAEAISIEKRVAVALWRLALAIDTELYHPLLASISTP